MNKTKLFTSLLSLSILSTAIIPLSAASTLESFNGKMQEIANYDTLTGSDKDGGVAEIVKYNKFNQTMYLVSGKTQSIYIVSLDQIKTTNYSNLKNTKIVTLASLSIDDAGDITSIDVSPDGQEIAIAIQHADYDKNGYIVRLDANGNFISKTTAGIQPDMITYTPDGTMILTANEGEPRNGYGEGIVDPKGTITVLTLAENKVTEVDFSAFDTAKARQELVDNNVIIKKDTDPSVDFEPEYITVNNDSLIAYVSLQEANSIATIDLAAKQVISVDSLGFKDYSQGDNKIDLYKNDGSINIANNEDFLGIYMPDGITSFTINGKPYLFTANEGDGREWGEHENELKEKYISPYTSEESKITTFDTSGYDGFNDLTKNYLFGGRSFSIIDATTMTMVSDSNADFEEITSQLLPEYFNCSNDDRSFKDRSGKKGPEAEDVKVMMIDDKPVAFIGLERIGGVMMYDVSDPANPTYSDYINLRDFSDDIAGSVSPEGLCTIEAKDSPTNKPLLLVANEVSGDVNIIEIAGETYQHKLTLDTNELTLYTGETKDITPYYTGYKTLSYSSDNETAVTVDNGLIRAIAPGSSNITITDGTLKTTCKITVTNPPVSAVDTVKQPAYKAVKTGDDSLTSLYASTLVLSAALLNWIKKR